MIFVLFFVILLINSYGTFNPRLSEKERFEELAIKNRFRYEDLSVKSSSKNEISDQSEEVINPLLGRRKGSPSPNIQSDDEGSNLESGSAIREVLNDEWNIKQEDGTIKKIEIVDEINEIVQSERDKRRHKMEKIHRISSWNEVYRVLLVSLMGLTMVLVITVLCNLCARMFVTKDSVDQEKIILVQDRFQQVYHGQ